MHLELFIKNSINLKMNEHLHACAYLTCIIYIMHNFDIYMRALNGDLKKLMDITLTELQNLYIHIHI